MDIDIICDARIIKIDEQLKPLGFEREGKYWTLDNSEIAIEVPSGPLAGEYDKVTKVVVKDLDLATYIIGIEDIIIDRLNRYKHWREYSDKEWIIGMMIFHHIDIDWDYLYEKAEYEQTLDVLEEFKTIADEEKDEL